ncbi:hypothetical protein [Actinobaculum sp. 313]|uniref:hypothetical protein n=1 Tax=Actinobaculum sp. 313 TaxID=2495645 RepID=UPI000D529E20|nr:hypothetical protein [Actinobaculum sp. 313]AWE42648.1 hypothetical protein DDD63_07685 [Actinobaculum sp. 313]
MTARKKTVQAQPEGNTPPDDEGRVARPRHDVGAILRFLGGVLLAVAVFAGIMVAIGVRLDQDPQPTPPSSAEKARESLVEQALRTGNAAQQLATANPDIPIYQEIADAGPIWAESLGGTWQPWPSGAPTGQTNPPLNTAGTAANNSELRTQLTDLADTALAASSDSDAADRATYLSISLGARLLANRLADTTNIDAPGCGDTDMTIVAAATGTTDSLIAADSVRQWLEIDAAALPADGRDFEVNRIESITHLEEAMIVGGTADTREAFAARPDLADGQSYTSVALDTLTAQLLQAAASADAAGREATVNYACSLYSSEDAASVGAMPGAN